ncbi:hypothetical protein C0Q70_14134 [Pomacea canaliculata]|uniref:Uncharacterized protein n=1 Tax=Pomacea canaliculata TaxID=400727 RepID=A0A2T7NZ58_POMCA|nr:hypothetical protein C0Q70_14134 [Pomacea canaliculata]
MFSSFDADLLAASAQAQATGSLTPILKKELWLKIQTRRLLEGKEELVLPTATPTTYKPTEPVPSRPYGSDARLYGAMSTDGIEPLLVAIDCLASLDRRTRSTHPGDGDHCVWYPQVQKSASDLDVKLSGGFCVDRIFRCSIDASLSQVGAKRDQFAIR